MARKAEETFFPRATDEIAFIENEFEADSLSDDAEFRTSFKLNGCLCSCLSLLEPWFEFEAALFSKIFYSI